MPSNVEIAPNRATERAKDAKGTISEIAQSISYVYSTRVESSTPPRLCRLLTTVRNFSGFPR
jgi:hypothetical protein